MTIDISMGQSVPTDEIKAMPVAYFRPTERFVSCYPHAAFLRGTTYEVCPNPKDRVIVSAGSTKDAFDQWAAISGWKP